MNFTGGGSVALVRNLQSNWIQEYLNPSLLQWLEDVKNNNIEEIEDIGKRKFIPFDAVLFVDVCNAYILAKSDGKFKGEQWKKQSQTADRLLSIMSAFAKVGIVALIDEITGYQEKRERNELQKLLVKYISPEFIPWTKRFPDEFYIEIFRLRRWEYKGKGKTPYVGKITNWLVYYRLPQGVLEELKRLNPILNDDNGYRRHRLFQRLSEEQGVIHLDKHISSIVTMLRGCETWLEFERIFRRSYKIPIENTIDRPITQLLESNG
ncbi:MAG: hypothetical protein US15_C0036G0003 [Candidatus Moranbacteria bacterium GW2011_GWF1_36_4]|nr:MAG: hypothetical protein US15_C0036G0003 [Candidatus Moranbacteria bacterium GW2011_GWF1_36_4]